MYLFFGRYNKIFRVRVSKVRENEVFNLAYKKLKSHVDLKDRIRLHSTVSLYFTAGRGWNGKTDLSGPQQSFSRGVSHIDASTISSRGALAGTPRGSRYPPTLQTSLQIVIRPITRPHINRDPKGRRVGRRLCAPSLYMAGAYCEHRIRRARITLCTPTELQNLFRSAGGQGCRKYDTRVPAGRFSRGKTLSRPLRDAISEDEAWKTGYDEAKTEAQRVGASTESG